MSLDIEWRPEIGKKVEDFFNDTGYKDYLENAVAFNRKLNEERKMRLPYIDGQTGVAQRHYNSQRNRRERMPGSKPGQIYTYPQKQWRKRKYQYLRYFLQPKYVERDAGDLTNGLQNENSIGPGMPIGLNEDSNASSGNIKDDKAEWSYYDDMFPEGNEDGFNSDSDFEYDDSYSRKKSKGSAKKGGKTKGGSKGGGPGSGGPKRRSNLDPMLEVDKPYSCELCGIKYKTRPGLKYHIKHSHKDGGADLMQHHGGADDYQHEEAGTSSSMGAAALTPPSTPRMGSTFLDLSGSSFAPESVMMNTGATPSRSSSRRSSSMHTNYREESFVPEYTRHEEPPAAAPAARAPLQPQQPPQQQQQPQPKKTVGPDGKERAVSLGYCDFCLGDANENKKTHEAEELVSCAECGRSGHPTCLQFTDNMLVSVRKYPWQCIECKCCTICGTSENDDQLLFCDDCDRGYHMYCLQPPIKEPPEGSWSCKLCIETFHTKQD